MFWTRSPFSLLFLIIYAGASLTVRAQELSAPPGKAIYHPRELASNDFCDPEAEWSFARMAYTDDVIVLWEKGFGADPLQAPDLDGQPMRVDVNHLLARVQQLYDFYRDTLQFVLPGSKSERYRMMVMLRYSLEGTAYGGDYDEQIGALWITPNRLQDRQLNCVAHELGHSLHAHVGCDFGGRAWGGCGFYEMASQWMLWTVNPEWTTEERYHWDAFRQSFSKRFLSPDNIYRSPYVLEYWTMLHGKAEIANLFRAARTSEEDPAMTYMRVHGLSIEQMNRQMADCYARLLTFDFPRVKESHRWATGQLVGSEPLGTWGFNVIDVTDKHILHFKSAYREASICFSLQLVYLTHEGEARNGKLSHASAHRLKR